MSLIKFISSDFIARNQKCFPPEANVTINQNDYEKNVHIHSQPVFKKDETPFYASFKKASYTIEATIILPLFITLMLFGIYTFRVLQVQSGVQQSIDFASRTMAVTLGNMANFGESDKDVDTSNQDPTIKGEISEAMLLASTIALAGVEIGKNKVPIEFVDGGALVFSFLNSSVEGNYIDLQVTYEMTFPIGLLGTYSFDVNQRARTRKWVGYDKAENTTDSRYVFITDKGERYHVNYNCTYLNPRVHRIAKNDIEEKRNKSGAKYNQCKRCKKNQAHGFYFITDYGTAFHTDLNCSEIKHNIKKVLYDEVKDKMPGCSKCAAGEKHKD